MAFTEEIASFFNTNDWATAATYTPLGIGGSPSTVNVIFDREYIEILVGTPGIEGDEPMALGQASDFPNAKKIQGDTLFINSVNYKIVSTRPGGTGMILLILEEPDG